MILDLVPTLAVVGADFAATLAVIFGDVTSVILGSGTANIVEKIRQFVLPVLGLVLGFFALKFLTQQEFMKFFSFLAIAILVFAVFLAPQFISNLGKSVGESAENEITWDK